MLPKLIREGHRILIFSQWTRVLDLLGCLLDTMETQFLRLDGQTTISERQTLIDQYTNDENIPVFLLSTRAGGMGINLTAADTCILHDLDFNPFNDIQAEDRVHRIGQKKPVTVIKMVTENTVDSDIYKMQERKAEMNAAILERKESTSETKGREKKEMNMIFEMAVNRYNSTST
jgi:SWI/SNF-related matrix-associated actin-dependent regulator 1 of chromatin subfamily A